MLGFFFDFLDSGIFERDDEGYECRDLPHARKEAIATLGAMARDDFRNGAERDFQCSVRDDGGNVLITADLMLRIVAQPA